MCGVSPGLDEERGGAMLGSCMKERWFATHAQYFVKFLQAYGDAGIKVNAVTVNNEVDTDQDGHFPATLWAQQHAIVFVASHLGPGLEAASLEIRFGFLITTTICGARSPTNWATRKRPSTWTVLPGTPMPEHRTR